MTLAALGSTISAVIAGDIVEQLPLLRHPPEQRAGLAKIVGYCRCRQYLDAEEGSFLARAVLRQGEEVRFASDLYGAFPVKRLLLGLLTVLCSERERPFFIPSPAIQFPERAERGQGTETLAELGGLPLSVACVSQRLDA